MLAPTLYMVEEKPRSAFMVSAAKDRFTRSIRHQMNIRNRNGNRRQATLRMVACSSVSAMVVASWVRLYRWRGFFRQRGYSGRAAGLAQEPGVRLRQVKTGEVNMSNTEYSYTGTYSCFMSAHIRAKSFPCAPAHSARAKTSGPRLERPAIGTSAPCVWMIRYAAVAPRSG